MNRLATVVFWIGLFVFSAAAGWYFVQPSGEQSAADSSVQLELGKRLFVLHCAKCHAADGRGDPQVMASMNPPPRDFQARPWRFDVSEKSIRHVIVHGVPGTAMVRTGNTFTSDQLDALSRYVMKLAEPSEPQATNSDVQDDTLGFRPLEIPADVPDVTLVDVDGNRVSLRELAQQSRLIHFWGTTCVHCLVEMTQLHASVGEAGANSRPIISICVDSVDAKQASEIANQAAPGCTVYVDPKGLLAQQMAVSALPAFRLLVDGKVVATRTGSIDWTTPEAIALLKPTEMPVAEVSATE